MHAGIVIWNLCVTRGGRERVGADLASAMLSRGHAVTVFFQGDGTRAPLLPLPPEARLCPLNISAEPVSAAPAWSPDLVKAKARLAGSGIDVLAALFSSDSLLLFPYLLHDTGIPLLVSEHNHPDIINNERWNSYERHACLASADRIHVLLRSYVPFYPAFLHDRITAIPNAAPNEQTSATPRSESSSGRLLAAGRFTDKHKQFSLLIEAFALLAADFPDWTLTLCGDGPDAAMYDRLIARHKLTQRVERPGLVTDMARRYRESDLLCIPSRYEGFPMVALEAQQAGLPVVGFAGCSGVNEIVLHGENGLLAENMNATSLAGELARLMADTNLRQHMAARSRELNARYKPDAVFDAWERLLLETAACGGRTRLQTLRFPDNEEERSVAALREILDRPAPFARPGWRETARRIGKLQDWQARVRTSWYYRIGLWFYVKGRHCAARMRGGT